MAEARARKKAMRLMEELDAFLRRATTEVVYFDYVDDASKGYGVYRAIRKYKPHLWRPLGPIHRYADGKCFVILIKLEK